MEDVPYRVRLKARLLQITQAVLDSEGLAAVQARRVAQEADCSVGTLYNVFGGLDGLIVEANNQTLREFGAMAETALHRVSGAAADQQLLTLALVYLDFATTHRRRWRAVFDHQMADAAPVPEFYRAEQGKLFGIIERALASEMVDPVQRARAARALFASVHGIVVIGLDRKLGEFDSTDVEQQVRFIVGLLATGLAHHALEA